MEILISIGPLLGVVVIAGYSAFIKIKLVVNNGEIRKEYKLGYYLLLLLEFILIMNSILIPKIFDNNYLVNGMSTGSVYISNEETFRISFEEAKRSFRNRVSIEQEEIENVSYRCTAQSGQVYLRILQDEQDKTIEITNKEERLDLSEYEPGDISFTLQNEEAKNVSFELFW